MRKFILILAPFIATYLFMAIATLEMNPVHWETFERGLALLAPCYWLLKVPDEYFFKGGKNE